MKQFSTLTELGRKYGESSHWAGAKLKALGLRHADGLPTQKAHDEGYVGQKRNSYVEQFSFTWHTEKTCQLLDESMRVHWNVWQGDGITIVFDE